MTKPQSFNRRSFLNTGFALGCSLAASPLITPVTMAHAENGRLGDNRLVVIILRGGMDGLDVIRPVGAAEFADLRGKLDDPGPDLNGFFTLHPALSGLMPLWKAGELGFAHAVSTPYRDKRSHFDGQDILEAGTGQDALGRIRDGWLNRLLQGVPGVTAQTAYAVGRSDMLILRGAAEASSWSPDAGLALSPQAQRLLELVVHDDPLFRDALAEAIDISQAELADAGLETDFDTGEMMDAMQSGMQVNRRQSGIAAVARFAAGRLKRDTRIASFSLNGYDTHLNQMRTLPRALARLQDAILTLKSELGDTWGKTTVLAMTEFGRTARLNGTKGTDHGTAGVLLMAGGALRGGRVLGKWPGLTESDLYQRRDLMPTRDVRAYAGWAMHDIFGLPARLIEDQIFPGLDMGDNPELLL